MSKNVTCSYDAFFFTNQCEDIYPMFFNMNTHTAVNEPSISPLRKRGGRGVRSVVSKDGMHPVSTRSGGKLTANPDFVSVLDFGGVIDKLS